MLGSVNLTEILRTIASSMQTPVVFLLIVCLCVTAVSFGIFVGEGIIVRLVALRKMKPIPELIEDLHNNRANIKDVIQESHLLKRQKTALLEVTNHPDLTELERESIAARLLVKEKTNYDKTTKLTDIITKVAPMLGLMGTLIPLGPGIIALGQGDTFTLSNSLMVAFDTTIAGLICAALAMIISTIRKSWYVNDMSILETLMECVLEEVKTDEA